LAVTAGTSTNYHTWRISLTMIVKNEQKICSVDQGIYGHLTLRNLAVLTGERGDLAGAVEYWRRVLAECRGDPEALAEWERFGQ
jgi:hypothetical protein